MWKNTLIFTLFIYMNLHSLSQCNVHNNKYQMKDREFAKHSETRKEVKDNIYAKQSEAGNFFEK